jgi:hypothetical protein
MKKLALFIFGLILSACSTPTSTTLPPATADQYFFPDNDNTFQYTYSQNKVSTTDTITYNVHINDTVGHYSQLIGQNLSSPNPVLFYFKNELASDGQIVSIIANSPSDNGFVALKGTMDIGATWYADAAQNVQATVVGKYAEFYLPGRIVHYNDVVVVQYSDKNAPSDNYIVRYFARNYGLILEEVVTGQTTEITNLQLLSRQGGAGSTANPDLHHDRWYNANGRYEAHMRDDTQDK